MAFQVDPQTGAIPLWQDTGGQPEAAGSLGLAIATATTLVLGLAIGVLPLARAGLDPLVGAIAVIPPIAVLPVLFITFGLGETAKIVLIVVGVTPFMAIRGPGGPCRRHSRGADRQGPRPWPPAPGRRSRCAVALPQAIPRLGCAECTAPVARPRPLGVPDLR